MDIGLVLTWIHSAALFCHANTEFESHPYDGWYNNFNNPDWGAAETPLVRHSPIAYTDKVYAPSEHKRLNPLEISLAAHHGAAGKPSYSGRTAMLVYFGQQIVEEMVDSQRPGCPIEYFNIPVPKGHAKFDPEKKGDVKMTFKRTRYDQRTGFSPNNPRQQLNEITPFLDGQVIYGPNKAWTDALRELKGGRLATTNAEMVMQSFPPNNTGRLPFANPPVAREHKLKPVSRFHAIGNPRGHENPFLLSFGILWFRWHNLQAARIARNNPRFSDEQIFNQARKLVIAQYQKIVFYDWLPIWLNTSISRSAFKHKYPYRNSDENSPYNGYNPSVHPGIFHEFQSAAMRYGHTLVTPGLWRRSGDGCRYTPSKTPNCPGCRRYAAIRLCNSFWDSRVTVEEDLDALFRGMASTIAEREDAIIVPDLTESLFGPLEFSRRDLAALNIQRGRDHGLADYNTVRESYGLKRKKGWKGINKYYNWQESIKPLRTLYAKHNRSVDDLDLFTGGLLETTPEGPGELFHKIILEQFLRIRHGDRFWFENQNENQNQSSLTKEELDSIWSTELSDIINLVTGASSTQIQRNVFLFTENDKIGCQEQPKQLDLEGTFGGIPMLEPCSGLETYDYFHGSEWSFAASFLLLASCIPVTLLIMYMLSKHRRQKIYSCRPPPQPLQRSASSNINEFRALEWIDSDNLERLVIAVMEPAEGRLSVYNTQRVLLRFVDLTYKQTKTTPNKQTIELHLSSDNAENLVALKLPEYDLVLRFYNLDERGHFVAKLETFLNDKNIANTSRRLVESYILRNTVTRKHRQDRLNKFFKKIFSMFQEGETDVDENLYGPLEDTSDELTRIELTQAEFGEAFGLKPNSTFVKHMFLLVDKDKSGRVSFKEFLDIFILLSSDNIENKIRLLFNMYDIKSRGFLTSDDISQMIRSLLDLSEDSVSDEKVAEFAQAVYKKAGIRVGSELTFADFKTVFGTGDYAQTIKQASLGLNDTEGADGDQAASASATSGNARMIRRRSTIVKGYSLSAQGNQGPSSCHCSGSATGSLRPPSVQRNLSVSSGRDNYTTLTAVGRNTVAGNDIGIFTEMQGKAPRGIQEWKDSITTYLETYRLHVFWITLYCFVTAGIFIERAYYYAVERENGGLRRIAGQGVTMSRGSASVIMFTYAGLLVTMCKNQITALRETVLHRFIPFDSAHSLHKFIACVSLTFTVVHVFFHGCNLYHICTQPSTDMNCYLREYFRASHELASFHYWAYGTPTGLSGVILTALVIVVFVFALPYARRHLFHAFQNTHKLYVPLYILMLVHGSARMVQEPHFPYYVIGPVILFVIDKLISYSRTTLELIVVKAELLPSDVTAIKVKKPATFEYKSGQWAQVACNALGSTEYHPFTMTSSPNEKYVTFHIRAVGPWTNNIRRVFDPSNRVGNQLPKLLLDGPFGEGHQDWYRFEVAILIGGGIGVTPFASILKDIVHRSQSGITMQCKKVYFLWVTRTQKQFEWVTDIIRDLESKDVNNIVTTHIFVTEFRAKFDLRTSMLYICERHFQKIAGKSLFTGLAATTHFGRPRFYHFLDRLRYTHNKVRRLGVFSCGPRPMTLAVESACAALNKYKYPTYYHHYENF